MRGEWHRVIELVEDAFGATPSAPVRAKPAKPAKAAAPPPPPSAAAPSGDAARVEEGRQRRAELRTEEAGPRRSREAIDAGLALFQAGEFEQAVDMFQLSLELPGVGFMRMDGSPKEYACASEGEENAALYNMACCYCKMGKPEAALTCLEALLDNGWDDAAAIRGDPDLAPARGPQMEQLLTR